MSFRMPLKVQRQILVPKRFKTPIGLHLLFALVSRIEMENKISLLSVCVNQLVLHPNHLSELEPHSGLQHIQVSQQPNAPQRAPHTQETQTS